MALGATFFTSPVGQRSAQRSLLGAPARASPSCTRRGLCVAASGVSKARNLGTSPWARAEDGSQPPSHQPAKGPVTWELHIFKGLEEAAAAGISPFRALMHFIQGKFSNNGKGHVALSDLVWTFVGMFVSVAVLGIFSQHVREWPVVGQWHEQGLGLLLGSFGTLCVLIFAAPDAAPVRVWNLLAGHTIATFIVLALIHVFGSTIFSRALAMAAMIVAMMWTDSVHPPGGALVLMAVDSVAIQKMDWWFMIYPSLTFTCLLLLPLGAATNWLKRNVRFDFPKAVPAVVTSTSSASAARSQQAAEPAPALKVKFA